MREAASTAQATTTPADYDRMIAAVEADLVGARKRLTALQGEVEETRRILAYLVRRKNEILSAPASDQRLSPAKRSRRGDITTIVLQAIRFSPGATSEQIVNAALEDFSARDITSPAKDRRKLVHSTISYLIKKGAIRRDEDKRLFEIAGNPRPD